MYPGVAADASGIERLERPGAANAIDVCKCDLKPLVAREVDADEACHRGQCSFSFAEVLRAARVPARTRPGLRPGVLRCRLAGSGLRCVSYSVIARGQCLSPDAAC